MASPEPRRLLVLRPTLGQGGADRVTLTLLGALDRRRFTPSLALVRAEGVLLPELHERNGAIPLHTLGARGLASSWRPLGRLLHRERPDVLFSTSSGSNLAAIVAARRARFAGRLVLSERNGLVRDQPRWKLAALLALKRRLYPKADAIAAVSEGVRGDLIRRLRLDPARVRTTYNPIVGDQIPSLAGESLELPWPRDGAPWILAAGRLEPAKDFATLLHALARLRERHPVRLAILGEGSQHERLLELASRLGCADAVRLPGFDRNPYRWMSRCTLFALSSRFEGLPGVLVQATACGAPVVATDCPFGPREIVADAVDGLLVPVGAPESLARACATLLADPARRADLAARGRAASERFRVEAVVPRYEAILAGEP